MNSLTKSSLRYLLRHPWQFGLSVLGIAMGVAIVVAIDIANYSSSKAFNLSMDAVAGKATHQITGTSEGIDDSFYSRLRADEGIKEIAPVVESYVKLTGAENRIFNLLGVDFFAERPFRNYLAETGGSVNSILKDFLTMPGSVLLSKSTANNIEKKEGDTLSVIANGKRKQLVIIGYITESGQTNSALENILITDIATAQEITESKGKIDYIDLILDSAEEEKLIKSLLPDGYSLQRSGSRSETAEQMLEAFSINLTSLSLLALIVGLFLVYNTMTFSVVQRKVLIGTLRSIGVTAREIFRIILIESVIIGAAGTLLGFISAYFISRFLIVFISQTINDLYFVISVREISISPVIILKGIGLGVFATIFSALKPAREGAGVHPRNVMMRSEQESTLLSRVPLMNIAGVSSIVFGSLILLLPSKNIWLSYIGILPVITGFALLTPAIIILVEKVFSPILNYFFGITGKFSSRSIIQNISRTYIAIAALGLAVAATVGVGTMITSFRSTVISWLEARLNADLFITAPSLISRKNDVALSEDILFKIESLKDVEGISYYREIEFNQNEERIRLIATGLSSRAHAGFEFKEGDPEEAWERFRDGGLLLSEPFAYKRDLSVGSTLELKTDNGIKQFKVCGIYYDYASDEGVVTIHFDHFRKHWNAEGVSGISAFVKEGVPLENVKNEILRLDTGGQELLVRTFRFIRDSSIEIFDRTFLIAKVLQALSVIVAFIGILSSLMSLQLERKRELGILRANGLLPSQVFRIVNLQTLLMGLTAGILSLPLGNVLAAILVYIINKRSFGWTMQFDLIPSIMLEAILISIAAALLAGLYPGYKMSKSSPALALREE